MSRTFRTVGARIPRLRSAACAALVLSALVVQGAGSASVPIGSTVLGVYPGSANPADVRSFQRIVGTKIRWAMQFDVATSWDTIASDHPGTIAVWGATQYRMVWGIPMLPSGTPSGQGRPCCGATLATEATGAYNTYFTQLGESLVANHQADAVLRIGLEFNGSWDAWSSVGQAATFVAAFRQVVQAFRSVPGSHFTINWNPAMGNFYTQTLSSLYPGDAYVDEVGFDVYDSAWNHYPGAKIEWRNLERERYGLNWLSAFAQQHHKPMSFPEWGLGWGPGNAGKPLTASGPVQGGDDGFFVAQMARWCATHRVDFANYFTPTGPVTNGRNPKAAAALRSAWG